MKTETFTCDECKSKTRRLNTPQDDFAPKGWIALAWGLGKMNPNIYPQPTFFFDKPSCAAKWLKKTHAHS